MLPQLHRQPWMDSDIETFRDQVRRYIAAEMAPKLPGWRGHRSSAGCPS